MWVWRGSYDGLQICCPGQDIFDDAGGFAEEVNGLPLPLLALCCCRGSPPSKRSPFELADSPSAFNVRDLFRTPRFNSLFDCGRNQFRCVSVGSLMNVCKENMSVEVAVLAMYVTLRHVHMWFDMIRARGWSSGRLGAGHVFYQGIPGMGALSSLRGAFLYVGQDGLAGYAVTGNSTTSSLTLSLVRGNSAEFHDRVSWPQAWYDFHRGYWWCSAQRSCIAILFDLGGDPLSDMCPSGQVGGAPSSIEECRGLGPSEDSAVTRSRRDNSMNKFRQSTFRHSWRMLPQLVHVSICASP